MELNLHLNIIVLFIVDFNFKVVVVVIVDVVWHHPELKKIIIRITINKI